MGRATYKCLDDLIAEGMDPKVRRHPEETAAYLKSIHKKEKLEDITVEEIMTSQPWQSNDHCLKSLFSQIPDTKALRLRDRYKELTTQ